MLKNPMQVLTTNDDLTAALYRAEEASRAADAAITARDASQAPALIRETLALTLEALAMSARVGALNPLENLLPNAVYYVRLLQVFEASPFDAIAKVKIGSSIGLEPAQRSDAERVGVMLERLAGGADALAHFSVMLEEAEARRVG